VVFSDITEGPESFSKELVFDNRRRARQLS